MVQLVLVNASVYSKSLVTQTVKKQELPKYRAGQNRTYEIGSL